MISSRRRNVIDLSALALGLLLGLVLASLLLPALLPSAHAHVDPVVASDHALRTVATVAPADAPDPPPSVLDRALDAAGPLGRLALGGIACLLAARLLAWQRAKRKWLRRGWVGNAAAASYGSLVAFGGVLALGGSISSGLIAIGGATFAGLGLARDSETARVEPLPVARVVSSGEDVPT